jgi:type VI secretion system secreted protein VgrG
VTIQSEKAQIDWAAAKKITLATAGGASVTIEGGNITFECPGTITVRAGTKSFAGGGSVSYPMPALPKQIMPDCMEQARRARVGIQSRT